MAELEEKLFDNYPTKPIVWNRHKNICGAATTLGL